MNLRINSRSIFIIGWTILITGCQASIAEIDSMPTTPFSEPIQLVYQPFKAIRYHEEIKLPDGRTPMSGDFSAAAERVQGHLILTVRVINANINGTPSVGANNGADTIRFVLNNDGTITDFVTRTVTQQIDSADNPESYEHMKGFMTWILPIYETSPVSVGQIAAHTISVTTTEERDHFTMLLKGKVSYRGIQAIRLDIDQLVVEQAFKPGLPPSFPERGYFIVDPNNGTVLKAKWIPLPGGETSVEAM